MGTSALLTLNRQYIEHMNGWGKTKTTILSLFNFVQRQINCSGDGILLQNVSWSSDYVSASLV